MSGQLQLATGGVVMIFFSSLNATQVVTSLDFDIQKATTALEECSAHITLSTLHTQTTNYPSKPQQFLVPILCKQQAVHGKAQMVRARRSVAKLRAN